MRKPPRAEQRRKLKEAQDFAQRVAAENAQLRQVLGRIVNLTSHPLFPDTNELPAFNEAIVDALALLGRLRRI